MVNGPLREPPADNNFPMAAWKNPLLHPRSAGPHDKKFSFCKEYKDKAYSFMIIL
jgi:hypothetical protein